MLGFLIRYPRKDIAHASKIYIACIHLIIKIGQKIHDLNGREFVKCGRGFSFSSPFVTKVSMQILVLFTRDLW